MTIRTLTELKTAFSAGARPSDADFGDLLDTLFAMVPYSPAAAAAAAGQRVVLVQSTQGYRAGQRVVYRLAGGTVEANSITTIDSLLQMTLTTDIGAGGIALGELIYLTVPA